MRVVAASLRLVCLSSALSLGACGGGGDGAGATSPAAMQSDPQGSSSAILKASDLTGTWRACKADSSSTSSQHKYTFTADSATLATYEYVRTAFPSADCSGTSTGYLVRTGKVQIDTGTQQVGSIKAQKVVFAPQSLALHGLSFSGSPTATYKQLLALPSSSVLQEGDTSQLGADGYPTALQSFQYARMP